MNETPKNPNDSDGNLHDVGDEIVLHSTDNGPSATDRARHPSFSGAELVRRVRAEDEKLEDATGIDVPPVDIADLPPLGVDEAKALLEQTGQRPNNVVDLREHR